jgi:zinc transport system substrate-binding protein
MKKYLIIALSIVLLSGCNNKQTKQYSPTVTVSIIPQKLFVDKIAGDWLSVNVMIPPGSSPATYEPSPMQMKDLSKSQIYFRIGHITFEKAWMSKLSSINKNMKIIDTSEGLDLISEEAFGDKEPTNKGNKSMGYNPHIWLSPILVKKQAEKIFLALKTEYPEHTESMKKNLNTFLAQCDSVQEDLNNKLKNASGTGYIVYHPVWSYLARDYNLKQIAIEHNGKEPTADKLKYIIDFAKKNNIKIVFVQKEFSDLQARTISKEIDGKVATMNPLDYNWFNTMKEFGDVFSQNKN